MKLSPTARPDGHIPPFHLLYGKEPLLEPSRMREGVEKEAMVDLEPEMSGNQEVPTNPSCERPVAQFLAPDEVYSTHIVPISIRFSDLRRLA